MNICVIGCGYVGSHAAQHWKNTEHAVTVTTRNPARGDVLESLSSKVVILSGSFEEAVKDQDVIILAVAPGRGGDYEKTYLDSAKELLKHIKPNQKIIYTGSTSVYGDQQGKIVDEETSLNPLNENAEILIDTEKELLKHPNTCIFRMGEILGPGRNPADRLKRLNGKELPGTGDNPINVTHVDDIVRALDLAIARDLTGIYNLCSDEHIPRKEWYEAICRREGIPLPKWNPSLAPVHGGKKIVSNRKIKQAGFNFEHVCVDFK